MDVITRVAGTGGPGGNSGDGGPAIDAKFSDPLAVAVTADGGFLIADYLNNEVRMVSAAGVITRVAGTGARGNFGDGGPAIDAELSGPCGVAVTADGGFLIVDGNNNMVRKVSAGGVITRVAGNGTPGNSGDGGPATDAQLKEPYGVAVTADGGFLIADMLNSEVRKVSAAGVITRVAGTGQPGNSGDAGPAIDAELYFPAGVAVTADGGFLIADWNSSVVRKVSAAGVITRVAGTGQPGNSGDGGPAIDAELSNPVGVAVTADGGFLITDNGTNEVRKVSAAGVITRVAGNGTPGNSGDGGPATWAQLWPYGVAVTADGGFLIADAGNNEVRKVVEARLTAAVITRVAGTGTPGGSGDGGQATNAKLFDPFRVAVTADGGFLIADSFNNEVRMVSAAGVITRIAGNGTPGNSGDGGPATDAQLNAPTGVAVTADGEFLIADTFNNEVRKVPAAGVITLVAGTGTPGDSGDGGPAAGAELSDPRGVAVTADGGYLIADASNNVVRKVSAAGVITRVAGTGTGGNSGDGGPATGAELNNPIGVAVTADGGYLIADTSNHVVRKVSAAGVITRVAGTGTAGNSGDGGPATGAELNNPIGVAVTADGGYLIADYLNNEVRKVSAAGVITRVAGTGTGGNSGDGGPATGAELDRPTAVAVTADGGYLIADGYNSEVRKVSAAGVITRVAGTGTGGNSGDGGPATAAELLYPVGVTVTADGGFLIADYGNNMVRKVSAAGVITRTAGTGTAGNSGDGGPATDAGLNQPAAVAVNADGGYLIADSGNNEVRKVAADLALITRVAGTGTPGNSGDGGPATDAQLKKPAGVAVNADGGYLIADSGNNEVRKVSAAGVITRVAGTGTPGNSGDGGPATDAQLNAPLGVAVTADGGFLIADHGNHEVRKVSAAGVITRVAGTGTQGGSGDGGPALDAQLDHPAEVAVTADGGFLIADTDNHQVRKVSAAGVITRVAGTGTEGNSGDDGPALDAQLHRPYGVAVTADGGFLIADTRNNEVRKVGAGVTLGVIIRVAGTGTPGNSGDGGPARDAQLNSPHGVAVTLDGGFLIADRFNNEVRMVSAAGVITRVAGTGTPGNSGDGGPATDAQLNNPIGVVANTTFLEFLIADSGNSVVRRALLFGRGTIGPAAGTGTPGNSGDGGPALDAQLDFPLGVAVTADGGILIADTDNHAVRKVSAGVITRVAGNGTPGGSGDGGPATDAQLNAPTGVAETADRGFLIVDSGNHVVRKVSAAGVITRVAGNGTPGGSGDDGPAADAQLNRPLGVAVTADGGFLIADSGNYVVRKVSAAGVITRVAGNGTPGGSGDGGPATDAQLYVPYGVAVTADGGFLIADSGAHVVRMVPTA